MSITPTTMKCPVCPEQSLETLSGAIGSFERCPNCRGLFIHQDLIVAASMDQNQCQLALNETRSLLLPIDKWCPRCLQKLSDGRVRSRKVILTLCTACKSFWTDLSVLGQFEEGVEKTLRLQIDMAMNSTATGELSAPRFSSRETTSSFDAGPDAGLGHFFRSFARVFDRWADRFSASGPRFAAAKPKAKPEKAVKSVKKPLFVEVQPAAPAPAVPRERPAFPPAMIPPISPPEEKKKEAESLTEAPSIEIPQFVFPKDTEVEEKPPAAQDDRRAPEPPPMVVPTPELVESKPEPRPEIKFEPEPEAPVPEPLAKPPVSVPKPETPKPLAPKPAEKKPLPQASSNRPGFFASVRSAWSTAPRKAVEPSIAAKPRISEKPKAADAPIAIVPAPAAEKPLAPSKPAAKPPKPAGEGFFAKIFSRKKSPGKSAVKSSSSVSSSAPVPAPAQVSTVKPSLKASAPVVKKPAPKPKKAKVPSDIDYIAVGPPWILGAVAIICSAFRDFGFEPLPAVLWGLAGWAIGFMIRLARLYPFRPFEDSDLNELAVFNGAASPVILKGRVVPADEQYPKREVVFKQEEKILRLNPIKTFDIIPRLFGLSNPRQLLQGDVTLRGWYRPGTVPALEVHEVRAEKASRKSMVRSLRWAAALFLLALAVVVSIALE